MSDWYVGTSNSESLAHFGTLGMKWGVRKYQNADGSLTPAGKERYYVKKTKKGNEVIRRRIGARKYINDDGSFTKAGLERYGHIADKYKKLGYSKTEIEKKVRYAINADVGLHRLIDAGGAYGTLGSLGVAAGGALTANPMAVGVGLGSAAANGAYWYKARKARLGNLYY